MTRLLLALGLFAAGCAAPAAVVPDADHPASPDAPTAPAVVSFAALEPAPAPDVPAVLRPDRQPPAGSLAGPDPTPPPPGVDHDATTHAPEATMGAADASTAHTAMNHGRTVVETPSPTPPEPLGDGPPAPVTPVGSALDAYLAVHDAFAADRFDAEAASAFDAAFADLVASPPPGDPHFWHTRSAEVEAAREATRALAQADDLGAGRAAFGRLSVPFAALVEAVGVPEGYDLARHTCGMTDAPEGGVWLQREGPVRNPYFGTGMLMCSRGGEAVGSHEGHGSGH